jgi:hypothetical protein
LTAEEGATVTRHERIYMAAPTPFPIETFDAKVEALIAASQQGSAQNILHRIKDLEPAFAGYEVEGCAAIAA